MSVPSLGAFSALAINHHESPVDNSALEMTPLPEVYIPSGMARTIYSGHDAPMYLSDRSRRSSGRSHRSSSKRDIRLDVLKSAADNASQATATDLRIVPSVDTPQSDAPLLRPAPLTAHQKRTSLIQFLAICGSVYVVGWNDGTTGPLLPRIQEQYNVGFTVVSTIFIVNCFGYLVGAALNIWLNEKIGFGKSITLGAVFQLLAYLIIAPAPPFPVLASAYLFIGFGLSLQAAHANGFVGSLQHNMVTKMGIMHGSYGLGAFSAPFASTYFSGFSNRKWAYHFIVSAVLSFVNVLVLLWVFRLRRQEDVLLDAGQEHTPDISATQPTGSTYQQIIRIKAVHLMTVFALIYIGVEVTLGGWIVTYIIQERHGGPSAGYISSGFFGGLTLGRIALMWLNKLVGEHRIIFVYSVIAIGLELTIWLVPSMIANAVAISIVGLVLGPMYPLLVQHMTQILPKWLLTGSVGLVTGIGVAGSAALPFITGLLSSTYGIGSLQPLMVSMMGALVLVWAFVPKTRRIE